MNIRSNTARRDRAACPCTTLPAFAAICLLPVLLWPNAAGAQTPCTRSAERMHVACLLGSLEERRTTLANCIHIADSGDRMDCNGDSRETRMETLELCMDQREARLDVCDLLDEGFYDPDPLLDPDIVFVDPDDIPEEVDPNPFYSLAAGSTWLVRAGEDGEETNVIHVTPEVREIGGVLCRVVVDVALESEEEDGEVSYEPVEVTDDWIAQAENGDLYYCGELSRNFEDGLLDNLDGSFEAGRDLAKAGVLLRAAPMAGDADRQEFALGTAEDIVEYLNVAATPTEEEGGDNESFPCMPDGCLKTLEYSPLEPDASEFKYYVAGTGFVLAVAVEDGELTGEREELVCAGDSLDVLETEACGVEDPEALLEALCTLVPAALCAE